MDWHFSFSDHQLDVLAVALGAARSMFDKYPEYSNMLHKHVTGEDIDILHLDIKYQIEMGRIT